MRIITRPDFDGIVCAVLLTDALEITEPTKWVEPNDMQNRRVNVREGDVIANLFYHENCSLWFDHHLSNKIDAEFEGAFEIAPSAARVIFDYYKSFSRDFSELVEAADKVDSAQLTGEEILHPERFPYVGIAATMGGDYDDNEAYWNHLVSLLGQKDIDQVMEDSQVKDQLSRVVRENEVYAEHLNQHTSLQEHISITDFRSLKKPPSGNRFLVFSLYPDTVVNLRIRYKDPQKESIIISMGHSIVNRNCNVNMGTLCSRFNGGGHVGAGSCSFPTSQYEENLKTILDILQQNQPG